MRLKNDILNRLINEDITSSELSLYIFIAQRSSFEGIMPNLKMRDFVDSCDFSKQTFYNALYSLQEKNFIIIQNNREVYFDTYLINNQFKNEKDTTDVYHNLNYDFLNTNDFHNLNIHVKRLLLRALSMKTNTLKYTKDTLKKYKCFRYLKFLSKFFNIATLKNGTYILNFKYTNKDRNLFYNYLKNKIVFILEKHKISYTLKDLRDAINVSYNNRKYFSFVLYAFNEMRKYGFLKGALLNKIITNKIKKSYS